MDAEYTIYFKGETLDGFDPDKVKTNFSTLFHLPQEKAAVFFNGKTRALKKGLTQEKTKLLIQTLNKAGLKVYIKKEVALPQEDAQAESKLSLLPLGADVLTPKERPEIKKAAVDTDTLEICVNPISINVKKESNIDPILCGSSLEAISNYENLETKEILAIGSPDTSHLSYES